jgi:hypothetical protein
MSAGTGLRKKRVTTKKRQVAEAVTAIVGAEGLPVAFTMEEAARKIADLYIVEHEIIGMTDAMRAPFEQATLADLEYGLFKAGCEMYARATKNPFVLVTSYFFEFVYDGDAELREQLSKEWLNEEEIKRSLPAPRYYARDPRTGERDEDTIYGGSHIGAVVFPRGCESPLLLRNEKNHNRKFASSTETYVNRAGRVLPADQVKRLGRGVGRLNELLDDVDSELSADDED